MSIICASLDPWCHFSKLHDSDYRQSVVNNSLNIINWCKLLRINTGAVLCLPPPIQTHYGGLWGLDSLHHPHCHQETSSDQQWPAAQPQAGQCEEGLRWGTWGRGLTKTSNLQPAARNLYLGCLPPNLPILYKWGNVDFFVPITKPSIIVGKG